jgi:protein tyrosine phosphatase (PTP) superfamily phosphohydrolase (DUF442 family)
MKKVAFFAALVLTTTTVSVAQEGSTIRNFFRVNRQICTGGQPTMEELEKLKADGVKSIVNLRLPGEYNAAEEAAKVKELGLRYFHIPFDSNNPKDAAVDEFLKVMAEKSNLPVFIHCTLANRVGGFWMIRRVLVDGWALEKAEEEARKIGLRNPQTREFALDYIAATRPQGKSKRAKGESGASWHPSGAAVCSFCLLPFFSPARLGAALLVGYGDAAFGVVGGGHIQKRHVDVFPLRPAVFHQRLRHPLGDFLLLLGRAPGHPGNLHVRHPSPPRRIAAHCRKEN